MKNKTFIWGLIAFFCASANFVYFFKSSEEKDKQISNVMLENVEALGYSVTESDGSAFDCIEPYDVECFTSNGVIFKGTKYE